MNPGEHLGWGGWWIIPMAMPGIMVVVVLIILYLLIVRGGFRPPWWENSGTYPKSETALEILKKRYAKGEITKEQFEQIKKDLLN